MNTGLQHFLLPPCQLFLFVCWLINLLYLSANLFMFACWLINFLYKCAHRINIYRSASTPPFLRKNYNFSFSIMSFCLLTNKPPYLYAPRINTYRSASTPPLLSGIKFHFSVSRNFCFIYYLPPLCNVFLFVCWLINLLYICAHRTNIPGSASTWSPIVIYFFLFVD